MSETLNVTTFIFSNSSDIKSIRRFSEDVLGWKKSCSSEIYPNKSITVSNGEIGFTVKIIPSQQFSESFDLLN